MYETIPGFTMEDLSNFHNNFVKNDHYTIMILGKKEKLNLEVLKEFGEIHHLTLEDVFGY